MPIDSPITFDPASPLLDTEVWPDGSTQYATVISMAPWQCDPTLSTVGTASGEIIAGRVAWVRTARYVHLWTETPSGPVRVSRSPEIPSDAVLAILEEAALPRLIDTSYGWRRSLSAEASLVAVPGGCVFTVGPDVWHWCVATGSLFCWVRSGLGGSGAESRFEQRLDTGEASLGQEFIPAAWRVPETLDVEGMGALQAAGSSTSRAVPLYAGPQAPRPEVDWVPLRLPTFSGLTPQERAQALDLANRLGAATAEQLLLFEWDAFGLISGPTGVVRSFAVTRRMKPFGPFLLFERRGFGFPTESTAPLYVRDQGQIVYPATSTILSVNSFDGTAVLLPPAGDPVVQSLGPAGLIGVTGAAAPVRPGDPALVWDETTVYGVSADRVTQIFRGDEVGVAITHCGYLPQQRGVVCAGVDINDRATFRILMIDPARVAGQADRSGQSPIGAASVLWAAEAGESFDFPVFVGIGGEGALYQEPITVARDPDGVIQTRPTPPEV